MVMTAFLMTRSFGRLELDAERLVLLFSRIISAERGGLVKGFSIPELRPCPALTDDLQDQLSAKNAEMYSLGEHVHELELKLADIEYVRAKVSQLRERSESERFLLLEQLEGKEIELQHSVSCIEKLEESISMLTLDSQCEIESLKLEIVTLDQTRIEAERVQEETAQEREKMSGMIRELETQVHNAEGIRDSNSNGA